MNNIERYNYILQHPSANIQHIALQLTDDDIRNYRDIYNRQHIHQYFMNIAYQVAARSTCIKRQVGAIIVKDKKIVSTGYNGLANNCANCNEDNCFLLENGKCGRYPIHAEINSCIFATPEERKNATMYITCQACSNCAAVIINSGITQVIYDQIHIPASDIFKNTKVKELQLLNAIRYDLYKQENNIYKAINN